MAVILFFSLQSRFGEWNKTSAMPLLARFQINDSWIYEIAVEADSLLMQQSP